LTSRDTSSISTWVSCENEYVVKSSNRQVISDFIGSSFIIRRQEGAGINKLNKNFRSKPDLIVRIPTH
jgi:hypothetical protein